MSRTVKGIDRGKRETYVDFPAVGTAELAVPR